VAAYEGSGRCPTCGEPASIYDHRERRWRHFDLFQYAFYLTAQVPRVNCHQHGVLQMPVPWATGKSGFTALFERSVIALLSEMSIAGVARNLCLSWDEVDGIMSRAVERGLERRSERNYRFIGIDEKAIKSATVILRSSRTWNPVKSPGSVTVVSAKRLMHFGRPFPRRREKLSKVWLWICGSRTSIRR